MPKGRPFKSPIRQNIVNLLFYMKKGYGYEIYKAYKDIFAPVTMRVIYYHLKTGLKLDIFKVEEITKQKGEYSWGESAEKTYYALGPQAEPKPDKQVEDYFKKKN